MHCFIWAIAASLLIVATATTLQLNRRALNAGSRLYLVEEDLQPPRRGYQQQDTARAFYSYGYSDDNAARAEYTARDGSSRGFYSYVDANGKLQTVKYEAGREQGFKADATNLPKAPIDDNKPVEDTAEVQEARKLHLNALREAEALAASLQEENKRAKQKLQLGRLPAAEHGLSAEDASILERVRAELTAMLAEQQLANEQQSQEENAENQEQERSNEAAARDAENAEANAADADNDAAAGQRLQPENADDSDLSNNLRTVYTLSDISSNSYLKLGDLPPGNIVKVSPKTASLDEQQVRVPISAYYTLLTPTNKYSVTTPTELRTIRIGGAQAGAKDARRPLALSRSVFKQRLGKLN